MQQERYHSQFSEGYTYAEFYSVGQNGSVKKIIRFEKTDFSEVYNLAFGDMMSNETDFDDMAISNNGDTEKILATVAFAVEIFTGQYPNSWVYATGSTPARNRLYQMAITKHWNIINNLFEVIAEINEDWMRYEKGKNYTAFADKRKD